MCNPSQDLFMRKLFQRSHRGHPGNTEVNPEQIEATQIVQSELDKLGLSTIFFRISTTKVINIETI